MDESRRKLPSWMLGVKNNENNCDKSSKNGCQKEQGNGKLVKGKRVDGERRENDEFEPESSDVSIGCDGGSRRSKGKKVNGKRRKDDGGDDEFELESSDVSIGDGGDRRIKRKVNGGSGYVEGDDESREGKKRGRGMSYKKGDVVDDMVDDGIGYGKGKSSPKLRNEKHGSRIVDSDDYDYDYDYVDGDKVITGKRSTHGRKRKGIGGKSGVSELEGDEPKDDGGSGAQVLMRKCKGKRQAGRGKLIDSNDLGDVHGASASMSDEEDLTVEDLVSIAREYVNKDMEAGQQTSLSQGVSNVGNLMSIRGENPEGEVIGENHASDTSIHDNTQSEGSFNSKMLNWEEARPCDLLNENVTVMKPIMTGDPTQDMLDLFLGHLLKRPQEEAKKLDISLAVRRQEPVAAPIDAVPFTKKKSSLKDKVAMFFD